MKKFYSTVDAISGPEGFTVELDGKPIKTPDRNRLLVPTGELAEAVAAEWRAQEEEVNPSAMPMTRLVNTAIDRVTPRRDTVISELIAYAHTDVVCYRADEPEELVAAQHDLWDPYLAWMTDVFGVELQMTKGIVPVTQAESVIEKLKAEVSRLDGFALTAFHAFVSGFGSIVFALALVRGFRDFEECWQASILEQTHQESRWGLDQEVEEKRTRLRAEMLASLDLWHFTNA